MKAVGEVKAVKLTVYECQLINAVVGSSEQGHTIKDLRLINGIVGKVKAAMPEAPKADEPKMENPQAPTEEEKKAIHEARTKHAEAVSEYVATEVEVSMTSMELEFTKSKISAYPLFINNEMSRAKILNLADKLGIQ